MNNSYSYQQFLSPFQVSILISVYTVAISSLILNSASPRVFAEQTYYTCFGVNNQPTINQAGICALPATTTLPSICVPEGDPISLTNYFHVSRNLFFPSSPLDYPLSTTFSQVINPGDPVELPTQSQNYTYPLSLTISQPSTTGSAVYFNSPLGLELTPNGTTGVDQINYTVSNSNGDSDTGFVVYKAINGSTSPMEQQAIPQAGNAILTTPITIFTNINTTLYSISIVAPASGGVAGISGSGFSYTANPGFTGVDEFTYRLTDSSLNQSSIQKVYVKVIDPSVTNVNAFLFSSFSGVTSTQNFSLVDSSSQTGSELSYFSDAGVNKYKRETHTYSTIAPAVSAITGSKTFTLKFEANVTNDPQQIYISPYTINDPTITQPIVVEHKNTPPTINTISSDYTNNDATISTNISDAESNNFDVVFELSKDNFSTVSETFTLSNQTNGSFNHTFTGLDKTPYSYRVRLLEVGSIPNLCNTFINATPQSSLNRQSSVFPLRSTGGTLYGVTNNINTTDNQLSTLIRTGGSSK